MYLKPISIFTAGCSPALAHARASLSPYLTASLPSATHLLLPVPSFGPDGMIQGGILPEELLAASDPNVTVIGGKLSHPALDGHETIDLLEDPFYAAENAALTAHCTLGLIITSLPVTLPGQKALIIGYGRIGKHLAVLLDRLGADITVAARKEADRASAESFGFGSAAPGTWEPEQYRVVINTVPAPVLDASHCARNALLIDLASLRGITGDSVTWARGLPGVCAPESSGRLIAKTALRLILGKEAVV